MIKIEAINALLNGVADGIKHKTSIFVLDKESIVNKRSRKLLDMNHMMEEDWEEIINPKWYDDIEKSKGVLCWIRGGDVSIVRKRDEHGIFKNHFDDALGDSDDVWPVKVEELAELLIDGIPSVKRTKRKQPELEEVDDGVEIIEGNDEGSQNESSETTVSPKEDVGSNENTKEAIDVQESEGETTQDGSYEEISEDQIPF